MVTCTALTGLVGLTLLALTCPGSDGYLIGGAASRHRPLRRDDPDACALGCPSKREPVCGSDYRMYFNSCLAKCLGVSVEYPGNCDSRDRARRGDCDSCTHDWVPVCAEHGVTYNNKCWAECEDMKYTEGECD